MKIKITVLICAVLFAVSGCAGSKSPLMNAASKGDIETVQILVKNGANINEKGRWGYTPLMWAIYSHKVEAVKAFIQMGADIEIQDLYGYTPIILAVSSNHYDIAKLLIEKHANVNAKDLNGYTPLIFAAIDGNASIVKLLIDNGADVYAKDNNAQTPLQYAIHYRNIDTVALLRMKGVKDAPEKENALSEGLKTPSRVTPEEGDYLIPAGREEAYVIAILDCNNMLIGRAKGSQLMNPVDYPLGLELDKKVMYDGFPKCMGKMGFKVNLGPETGHDNIKLRSKPDENISEEKYKSFIRENNFYDSMWNPQGSFKNYFTDNRNGTITDKSTGLMWQKGGSSEAMPLIEVEGYIQRLNKKIKLAGYSDWRVPTIDELASLLKRKKKGWWNTYINLVFEKKQYTYWSSDIKDIQSPTGDRRMSVWSISFDEGSATLVETGIYGNTGSPQKDVYNSAHSGSMVTKTYYIRAVRTIK